MHLSETTAARVQPLTGGSRAPASLGRPARRSSVTLRFRPPELSGPLVRRDRLLTILDLAAAQRLTTVVAPPGYGKTTLLVQWAASRPPERLRWLSITPEHDIPRRLAEDLCGALTWGREPLVDRLVPRVGMAASELGAAFLSGLLDEIEGMPPVTLVLDDLHLLTNTTLLDELATLLQQAPRSLHVVTGTQSDPPPHYYRLRLSDTLVELRQEDLAFTRGEAAALLTSMSGQELSQGQVDALVQRTEGWAVGLQLAALSLRDREDVDAFIEVFAGDDRHVGDYLTEHVLDRQPEEVRRFLMTTSVLQRLTGPLCDAITGGHQSQSMLEELDRTSMFVTRLDRRRTTFRYHELLRLLLRHHLNALDPELEHRLLERAGRWQVAMGDVEAGVDHLLEAGAWDEALDTMVAHGNSLLAGGRVAAIIRWIDAVPPTVVGTRIDARLMEAAALLFGGEPARLRTALLAVGAAAEASPGQRVVGDLLHSLWALQQGDVDVARACAERALGSVELLSDGDIPDVLGLTGGRRDVSAGAHVVLGLCLSYLGDPVEARRHLTAGFDGAHAVWQVSAMGALAQLEAWSGSLDVAAGDGRQALALARQLGMDQQPVAMASMALAHVATARGDYPEASRLLDDAEMGLDPERRRVQAATLAIERASIALAEGRAPAGLTTLAARRGSEHPPMPRLVVARRCAVEAELLLASGDIDAAERVLDLPDEPASADVAAARVHTAVARDDLPAARAVLEEWPSGDEPRTRLQRLLWLAVVDHLEGNERASRSIFDSVAAEAAAEGDVGLFRAAGDCVLGPARSLYNAAPTPFLRAVVEAAAAGGPSRPRSTEDLVEQLTEREYVVLVLLPTRLSNVEIADRLDVSLNTVKTHIKRIYRKLGATRRSEAVTSAERLRLL